MNYTESERNTALREKVRILHQENQYLKKTTHPKEYWLYTFAGHAMESLRRYSPNEWRDQEIAERAVKQARALLAELEKETLQE